MSLKQSFTFLLLIISWSALALPNTKRTSAPKNCTSEYVATYEDIPALPGSDPGLNPPSTPYRYLAYTGFSVNNPGVVILQPTYKGLYYDLQTELFDGKPGISKNYDKSTVIDFDLRSFTFLCGLQSVESVQGVGVNCTVNVSGQGARGPVRKSCKFVQKLGSLTITPATCSLGSQFTGLSSVAFESVLQLPVSNDAIQYTGVDNVSAKVRKTC